MADDPILVAGEALYDLVVQHDGTVNAHPGGGPFNAARTIARLGRPVAFLGRLSGDSFGRTLERVLAEDGVRLDAVVRTGDPTTLALAELEPGSGTRYRFYEKGTSAPGLTPEDALGTLPASVAIAHVGSLGLVFEPMATAVEAVVDALAGRALVIVDPNCRPAAIADLGAYRARLGRVLQKADVVKVSDEDLAWLDSGSEPVDAARALLDSGPQVALVTRGADGAVVVSPQGEVAVPAPQVDVVDTIGAGDAFGAAFAAWWRGRGLGRKQLADTGLLEDAARFAVLVAARTCERPGASPPRLGEIHV